MEVRHFMALRQECGILRTLLFISCLSLTLAGPVGSAGRDRDPPSAQAKLPPWGAGNVRKVVEVPPARNISSSLFSHDGRSIATVQNEGDKPGMMQLWDSQKGTLIWTCETPVDRVLAFSPDDKILVETNDGRSMHLVLWDATTGRVREPFSREEYGVRTAVFSPDGKTLATGGLAPREEGQVYGVGSWMNNPGETRLWDVKTGKLLHRLKGHAGVVLDVAFAPDGKMLASASWDQTVGLWDVETGALKRTLRFGDKAWGIFSVAFSPDGRTLATGSGVTGEGATRGELRLWRVDSGELTRTISDESPDVVVKIGSDPEVVFSPDGKMLASLGSDETVILWDLATGKYLRSLSSHSPSRQGRYAMRFNSAGIKLASKTDDGRIEISFWANK